MLENKVSLKWLTAYKLWKREKDMSKIINEDYRTKLADAIYKRYKIWYGNDCSNPELAEICRQFTYISKGSQIDPFTTVTISDVYWLAKQIRAGVSEEKITTDARWKRFEIGRVYLTRWDCPSVPEKVRRAA